VAIARALVFRPPILLGDEPTGNLDSATGVEILRLLDDLHREYDNTVLLVTHNDLAAAFCDRILTLHDGQFVKEVQTGRTGSASAPPEAPEEGQQ
jgi:ABC-type lipoprotein export system ATPase subunit